MSLDADGNVLWTYQVRLVTRGGNTRFRHVRHFQSLHPAPSLPLNAASQRTM